MPQSGKPQIRSQGPDTRVFLQLDGLSRRQMERALKADRMPFLASFIKRPGNRIYTFYSGVPSTTPAVQGELFYGVPQIVPSFSYGDPNGDGICRMWESESVKARKEELEDLGRGILNEGGSFANIYAGGSRYSVFCAETLGRDFTNALPGFENRFGNWVRFFGEWMRLVPLIVIEILLAIKDFIFGMRHGMGWRQELKFIPARVGVSIALRTLVRLEVEESVRQGLPVVFANFLGYDEQSHRRGPNSAFAHWVLRGIDRELRRIDSVCREHNAPLVIYSDHGQEEVESFRSIQGEDIATLCGRILESGDLVHLRKQTDVGGHRSTPPRDRRGLLKNMFPRYGKDKRDYRLAANGPVGQLYVRDITKAFPLERIARQLVEAGVPAVGFLQKGEALILAKEWDSPQPETHWAAWLGEEHPFLREVIIDLRNLLRHRLAGDLVLFGWRSEGRPISFSEESGAHGGPGTEETHGFLAGPEEWWGNPVKLRPGDVYEVLNKSRNA